MHWLPLSRAILGKGQDREWIEIMTLAQQRTPMKSAAPRAIQNLTTLIKNIPLWMSKDDTEQPLLQDIPVQPPAI